jgi:quinol monooxygenase YgiN
MLIAHVIFSVDEDRRPGVLERLNRDACIVKSMEGCLAFIPFANPANSREVGILHEWRSADDFARYTSSATFAHFQAELRPMMVAPPVSRRFEAELIRVVN